MQLRTYSIEASGIAFTVVRDEDGKFILPEEARDLLSSGTALKPAWEPICLARKPLTGTVAANMLEHSTGALNVDGCRVGDEGGTKTIVGGRHNKTVSTFGDGLGAQGGTIASIDAGRWPANLIHDGSDDVLAAFPGDEGRFFYSAKASRTDRDEGLEGFEVRTAGHTSGRADGSLGSITKRANIHPTVKPTDVMRWLCRLVTPPGGVVLDPFMGSGSTGKAAVLEGFRFVGIEREAEYMPIAEARVMWAVKEVANPTPKPPKKKPANDNVQQLDIVDYIEAQGAT